MATWQAHNYDKQIPDVSQAFTLTCPKETDIYDKPPTTHRFDAPVIYTTTTVDAFKSVAVTVEGDWTYQYDQGGLCVIIYMADGSKKWIKTGIEMVQGQPWISVVTKDNWADWSLRPIPKSGSKSARLLVEPHDDGALWVFVIGEDGGKIPAREVTWWADLARDAKVEVGPATAKPSKEGGDLLVNFSDFVLETA